MGSLRWYVALHVLFAMGTLMEDELFAYHNLHRITGGLLNASGTALQLAHGLGALALGVLFDRMGPPACFLASNLSYLVFAAASSLGWTGLCHVARILAHPTLCSWALALRECPGEDRAGFIAHISMTVALMRLMSFNAGAGGLLVYWGGGHLLAVLQKPLAFCLPLLSLSLGSYISRPAADTGPSFFGASKGGADEVLEATTVGKHMLGLTASKLAPSAAPLPAPIAMLSSYAHERLRTILSRPGVCTIFVMMVTAHFTRELNTWAIRIAVSDASEPHFSAESLQLLGKVMDFLFFTIWSCLPGAYIRRFGPKAALQACLGARAVVLFFDAMLYLLPVHVARGALLHLSLAVANLAIRGLDVVCSVLLVGVVSQSERGTLVSLQHFGGIDRTVPLPLLLLAAPLYKLAGVPGVFGLTAAVNAALFCVLRSSALMHVRLKDE